MNTRSLAITFGMLLLVPATALAEYNATVVVFADKENNFNHKQGQPYEIDKYFPGDKPPDAGWLDPVAGA